MPGTLPTGPFNAITDVAGVRVGQTTVRIGDSVRTGVTAILPHEGNAFLDRVPAIPVAEVKRIVEGHGMLTR